MVGTIAEAMPPPCQRRVRARSSSNERTTTGVELMDEYSCSPNAARLDRAF
jgi:hypothetical protein